MRIGIPLIAVMMAGTAGQAAIVFKTVEYKRGETVLEGLSVHDDALQGKRPAVLVVHQWMGLGDYERKRAEMLAGLGYNVLAADIYGKGIRPANPKEAGAEAGKYKNDRALLRARVGAGLEALARHELTDPKRLAAIGYCLYAGHDSKLMGLKSPVGRTNGTTSQKQLRSKHPWEGSWRQDHRRDEQEPDRRPRPVGQGSNGF